MARTAIGGTVGASFAFISTGWRQAWAPMALVVAISTAGQALTLGRVGDAFVRIGVVPFLSLLVSTMALGAIFRSSLRSAHPRDPEYQPGPAGVQWGGLEWRVLGASLLVSVILVAVVFAVFLVWVVALGFMSAAHLVDTNQFVGFSGDRAQAQQLFMRFFLGPGGIATAVIWLIGLALIAWLGARLSLVAIQAADTRSFNFGKAWATTHGAFWAVVVATLVRFLIAVAVGLLSGFVGGAVGSLVHLSGGYGGGAFWGGTFGTFAVACVSLPMTAGLVLFVYEHQLGRGEAVADQFA